VTTSTTTQWSSRSNLWSSCCRSTSGPSKSCQSTPERCQSRAARYPSPSGCCPTTLKQRTPSPEHQKPSPPRKAERQMQERPLPAAVSFDPSFRQLHSCPRCAACHDPFMSLSQWRRARGFERDHTGVRVLCPYASVMSLALPHIAADSAKFPIDIVARPACPVTRRPSGCGPSKSLGRVVCPAPRAAASPGAQCSPVRDF
jgi:hypothetical protein